MGTRTRIIWGKWDCTSCGTKGISAEPPPGEAQPKCPHCGSPREASDGEAAYLDNARSSSGKVLNANEADTKVELDIALSGADWKCTNCGGDNRALEKVCHGCGSPRSEEPKTEGSRPAPAPQVSRMKLFLGVGAALLVLLLVGGVWWGTQTHDVDGTVTAMKWVHTVERQTFTKSKKEDWKDQISFSQAVMPVDGRGELAGAFDVRDCQRKHHHDRKYECGTEKKCSNKTRQVPNGSREVCSTTSNNNGSFTETCRTETSYKTESYQECLDVTKYCTEPIYQDWCTYSTYVWQSSDVQKLSGDVPPAEPLPWPTIETGSLDRLVRQGAYTVTLTYDDGDGPKTYDHPIGSESDYRTWHIGDPVTVAVQNLGSGVEVRRPSAGAVAQ